MILKSQFPFARVFLPLVKLFISKSILTSLPILKQFNEVGGILYGAIKALLIIYVVLAIVFLIICNLNVILRNIFVTFCRIQKKPAF